jgi:hypothetical protein
MDTLLEFCIAKAVHIADGTLAAGDFIKQV